MQHRIASLVAIVLVVLTACTRTQTLIHPTDEPFRSVYHHSPETNWMNDPNGMFYDPATGLWHLYYQHYPEAPVWGPMHWAHSVSRDLIHWDHLPIAIYPDSLGFIFSGSAVIDRNNTAGFGHNALVAVYTSAAEAQHQSIAYSLDTGRTFTKYEANPVLRGDIPDFRDPKVFWDEQSNQWTMALACQQEVRFYGSPDLKQWTLLSRFGEGLGCHDGVWECPDLIRFKIQNSRFKIDEDKYVLLVNINPGGPFGGSATQYFVGNWDGREFKCLNDPINDQMVPDPYGEADRSSETRKEMVNAKWLDYGKDHYATVTFHNAPDDRIVALGWMSNWQYANQLPTVAFRSQNTIARDLSLYIDDAGEYRVRVLPAPENEALKGDIVPQPTDACIISLALSTEQDALITLSNDLGEKVTMTLDCHHRTFSMDRTAAGDGSFSADFATVTTVPLFKGLNDPMVNDPYGEADRSSETRKEMVHKKGITLFIDHCSIEAFDAEGAWAMSNLVFPTQPYNHLEVVGGEATIYDVIH